MGDFPWRLVTFDVDGTLTRGHGWRFIAEQSGRLAQFDAADARYRAGTVGENAHLRALLNIAVGHTLPEMERLLERTPKIAHIADTVAELHRRGARVALLSHNPEFVCRWYRQRFGFDDYEGSDGTRLRSGRILPYGPLHVSKVQGMRRLRRRAGVRPLQTIHIGDGRADSLVFPHIGGGIALNAHVAAVRAAADVALTTTDLRDVLPCLDRIRPHRSSR